MTLGEVSIGEDLKKISCSCDEESLSLTVIIKKFDLSIF